MSRILKQRYDFGERDVAFFDLFASPSSDFEAGALTIIQKGLNRGAETRQIRRAARLLQAYELMFWDTLYQASVSAPG